MNSDDAQGVHHDPSMDQNVTVDGRGLILRRTDRGDDERGGDQWDAHELLFGTDPVGRHVAGFGDETCDQVRVCATLEAALESLAGILGEESCGLPRGVYDLDTQTTLGVMTTVTLTAPA